jgi:dihydrofolate reductase
MHISIIVATDENGVIGNKGAIPWNMPADMDYFRQKTLSHPIIMGRKTYESIGRILPNRPNIIISRNKDFAVQGAEVAETVEEAIEKAKKYGDEEIFIIGGESVYKLAMPYVDRIYLTKVHAEVEGDRFFKFDTSGWKETSGQSHPAGEQNQYAYEFLVFDKQ